MKKIFSYDTTLRDGAARVGLSFSLEDKLKILKRLDAFHIDFVECGYPASNPKDAELFRLIPKLNLQGCTPCAFGHTRKKNGDAAKDLDALLEAQTETICIYGKAAAYQATEVLGAPLKENIRMIADSIAYLKAEGRRVIFDAEHFFDGYQESPSFAMECLAAASQSGCDWIVLCDTNGGGLPFDIATVVQRVVSTFSQPVGIHAHNDAALAVANSLAAVRAGATMVQGTINGYGERCGNADLCAVIPNLALKMDCTLSSSSTLTDLTELSRYVAEIANVSPNHHQPYVGKNAFGHKGGAHVHAVSKNARCYEHIDPQHVGNRQRTVVSEISGKQAVAQKAIGMGLDDSAVNAKAGKIADRIKELEHRGFQFEAAEGSFEILVRDIIGQEKVFFDLESFRVITDKLESGKVISEATIKILVGGKRHIVTAEGNGPVNAIDSALRTALREFYPEVDHVVLTDYKVRVLDEKKGTAAVTRVLIESSDGVKTWSTVGVSENIIEASWQALAQSVIFGLLHKREPQAP